MDAKRQKNQEPLASLYGPKGETPTPAEGGTESSVAKHGHQSPTEDEGLMEEICQRANLLDALHRVQANKGSPGVDGMNVRDLPEFLKVRWPRIRSQLLEGTYKPQPVKRVEIPKPEGGVRKLGIPTVLDRFIQQAVLQVLQARWDKTFSEGSFGFRPGRSAHQAVEQAQKYIAQGHGWVVDIDLEKFFDKVNHDRLMSRIAEREKDKRLLKLIRAFLNAGVMENGLVSPTDEGTPQGGPLSPLLSNLVLDELDKTLEERGLKFVRYADDCNIYVKSERAGLRVMKGVSGLISRKLKLKVNESKSAVARPRERKFLGFSFMSGKDAKRRIAPKALDRFKERIRELTSRTKGVSLEQMAQPLTQYLRGWKGYFGFCQTPSVLRDLDSWIRRRLRGVVMKQWKRGRQRYEQLRRHGVGKSLAAQTAASAHGPWRISLSPASSIALPNEFWERLGIPRLHPTPV